MPKKKTNAGCVVTKKRKTPLIAEIRGEKIDISEFDFGNLKLDRQKLFCFYYSYFDSESYQNGAASARKAGYNGSADRHTAWNIRLNKDFQEASIKLQQKYSAIDLRESYNKAIRRIQYIDNMKITDYYNFIDSVDENGNAYTRISPKRPEELTDKQLEVIEMIDWTTRGIPKYIFPSKERARQFIIQQYEKEHADKDKNDFDVTLTLEGIKEQVSAKVSFVKKNQVRGNLATEAGFIADKNDLEEED